MSKIVIPGQYIVEMDYFLSNYCQLKEETVFRYQNISHDDIFDKIKDPDIARFPIKFYQDSYAMAGAVLWVKDRTGRTLPYFNPHLLSRITKRQALEYLQMGRDLQNIMLIFLTKTESDVVPTSLEPQISGTTTKKSYQKRNDYNRKRGNEI